MMMKLRLMAGLIALLVGASVVIVVAGIAAPLLWVNGWPHPASFIYHLLSYICGQLPSRTLWLSGAPMGVCIRNFSLYLGFAGAGLWMLTRPRMLSWQMSLFLLIPIFADTLTHLAGWRESTNLLRALTGAMAGIGLAGFVILAREKALALYSCKVPKVWCAWLSLAWAQRPLVALLSMAILAASLPLLPTSAASQPKKVMVKEGTFVSLRLKAAISSETCRRDEFIDLEALHDVKVDGVVAIKAGASARGQVDECTKLGYSGRGGNLRLLIISVRAVDDQNIPIRTSASRIGEDKMGEAIGIGIFCPAAAYFTKGEPSNYPSGFEFQTFTATDKEIDVK